MSGKMFTSKAEIATFGGVLHKLSHHSDATGTDMALNLFMPGQAAEPSPVPLLVYLSGLTCTPDNCAEKGFVHAAAARRGIAVLYPDTSPRGLDPTKLPGLRDSWDFGEAASFYVDATRPPWDKNFRIESYLIRDLLPALPACFPIDSNRVSICGHSMGGHGALSLYLRHPGRFRSVSAWAPVANPSQCPWGQKAFAGYLSDDRAEWARHDATELVREWKGPLNALIDVVREKKIPRSGSGGLISGFARQLT